MIGERHYTITDARALEAQPDYADARVELIEGVLVVTGGTGPQHGKAGARVVLYAGIYLLENDIGHLMQDSVEYVLSEGVRLIPDASFIRYERLRDLPATMTLAPDLAVEIYSPSNRQEDMLDKVRTFLRFGTRLVWVIYPDDGYALVCRPAEGEQMLLQKIGIEGVLDGGDVLPGLQIPLRAILDERK